MNKFIISSLELVAASLTTKSQIMNNPNTNTSVAPMEQLTLTQEWDKVFPKKAEANPDRLPRPI